MQPIRSFAVLLTLSFIFAGLLSESKSQAQVTQTPQTYQAQPFQQQQLQQKQAQQNQLQQQPLQQSPIRMQTMQTPPKSITHNGVTVYQNQQQSQEAAGYANSVPDRTTPAGFASSYPTGTAMVATNRTDPQRQNPQPTTTTLYPPAPSANPTTVQQNAQPPQSQHQITAAYLATVANPNPAAEQNPIAQPIQPAQTAGPLVHKGRAAPVSRIQPFILKPEEQQELDEFLARWENYSDKIKRYDVDFTSYYYDPTVIRANQADMSKPVQATFGFFKYVAPSRFVFNVEGEWINGEKVKRSDQPDGKTKVYAEKILIDEKTVYYYDFNAKTVKQINIPADLIGKGIADSPLPLIFGAKAEDMKRRFFMKIVTAEQHKDSQIWLQARPKLIEDQAEFAQIEIRLDKKTLRATALKKDDINGKAYTVYVLSEPKINPPFSLDFLSKFFNPDVPKGWKHVVEDFAVMQADLEPKQPQGHPQTVPAQPHGNIAAPVQRNEIPLYNPQ